jgi:hypothetical protein
VDEGEGGVDYLSRSDTHEYVYYSYAIDAQVVPVGDGPFWELVGGVLKMSCSVILHGKLKMGERNGKMIDMSEVEIESLGDKKEAFRV